MGSIEQAKQININGVYKIGLDNNKDKNKDKTPNIDTLESWIRLEADFVKILDSSSGSSGPPKCEKRTFTYEELNELKSMIMLLAKRPTTLDSQDDEIPNLEYFIEVFDNVVRLTETFRLLINKGFFSVIRFLFNYLTQFRIIIRLHIVRELRISGLFGL